MKKALIVIVSSSSTTNVVFGLVKAPKKIAPSLLLR